VLVAVVAWWWSWVPVDVYASSLSTVDVVVVVVVVIAHCQFGSWWSLLFGGDGWQLLSLHDGGQSSHCCMAVLGAEKKQDRDSNRKQEETDSKKEQD